METISVDKEVARLLRLTSDHTKKNLSECSNEVAIAYLAELFKGNGWIVSIHTGYRNSKSVLLSEPRQPDNIILIVKFIADKNQITYERAKAELTDFETNIGPVYGCSQFCILTINGFESKAERLENFNLLLQNWSDMEEYIAHYSKDKVREPRIQLFAHNKQTYKKVRKLMEDNNAVAVVQATGTGKSYLIARLLQDFAGERKLVMAPSHYIIDQIKEHIRWESDNIEFMTYAKSMNLTEAEIAELKPKMIVLDEFHRCGAEEWGRGVQNIIDAYPRAFRFGTSATPVRYLDNGRDMSNELFKGHVAENLNLAQAIVRNILPMPKYVCALYTLEEEVKSIKSQIRRSSHLQHVKQEMLDRIDAYHIDFERTQGIPHVLKKHLKKTMRKLIVFCKDEQHLLEMEPVVKKWFKEAWSEMPVKTYRVYTNEDSRDEQLEDFKTNDSKEHLHLLFSVNMLNEGLHVNEVHGVILLRPTESPNIFYQQIGRCLKVGMNHNPVIFDFVNNFRSIRTKEFLYDLDFSRLSWLEHRTEQGLEDRSPRFIIEDEVRKITDVFGEIHFQVDNWDEMFELLMAYKKRFGDCNIPGDWEEHPQLSWWLKRQRERKRNGKLDEDRYRKLKELGVDFTIKEVKRYDFDEMFARLLDFRKKHGHIKIPYDGNVRDSLHDWFYSMRQKNYREKLLPEYKKKFDDAGIELIYKPEVPPDERWKSFYAQLSEFKNKHGHLNVPGKKNSLRLWIINQRKNYRTGKLSEDRVRALNLLGLDFYHFDEKWEKRYNELLEFKKEHGHMRFNRANSLHQWTVKQRQDYNSGKLSEYRLKKLMEMGFSFAPIDEQWEKNYRELVQFQKEHGHCKVPSTVAQYKKLWHFVSRARATYKRKEMSRDQIILFEKLGFDFEPQDNYWDNMYAQLEAYFKKFGHSHILANSNEYPELGRWSVSLRKKYREKKLTAEQIRLLEKLNFPWTIENIGWKAGSDIYWNKMYAQLEGYYKKFGHSHVPVASKEFPALGTWCTTMRGNYRAKTLSGEQIRQLEKLNFPWSLENIKGGENYWDKMYAGLQDFYKKSGHSYIPATSKEYPELGAWCKTLRRRYREKHLSAEEISLLEKLNFSWTIVNIGGKTTADIYWNKMYAQLEDYYKKFGHSHVPVASKEFPALGTWCTTVRKNYRAKTLTGEKIKQLEKLNFPWTMKNVGSTGRVRQ